MQHQHKQPQGQQQQTVQQMEGFPKHLRVVRQLGRGAYGTVHLCEDTRSGQQVAVKHVRHAARHGKSILREVRLLARLWHENLLHLVDFPAVPSVNFEDVFLVLPFLPADLHKVIQSQQALTEKHVQVITCQLLRALAYLHAAGVAHRDLKPANILLTADCKLKVCDFGLARGDMPDADGDDAVEACGVLTEYVVTRWYRAPEVMLLPKQYTQAVDLWSAGCIICEILGRRALFPGKNHIDMVCQIAQVLGTPSDAELSWLPKDTDAYRFLRKVCPQSKGVPLASKYPRASPACLDLAYGLLRWDPAQRLTAAEAQEHEYVRAYLPKEAPSPPEPFDWSFDGFKPTANAVKDRLYEECARYHPEIRDRDRVQVQPRVEAPSITVAGEAPTPPAPSGALAGAARRHVPPLIGGYPSPPRASGTPTVPHRSSPGATKSPPVARYASPGHKLHSQYGQRSAAPSSAGASGTGATSARALTPNRGVPAAAQQRVHSARDPPVSRALTPQRGMPAPQGLTVRAR